jgi:hypothetical protein
MRKRVIGREPADGPRWLDLDAVAQVEVTSEDAAHPIERALTGSGPEGWLAATPGEQVIRLLFDEPATIRSIEVRFDERDATRTQEFVLRWSPDRGQSYREIVRQQYTFSPGSTGEIERYAVEIAGMTALELRVIPDIQGGAARASLSRLRLA